MRFVGLLDLLNISIIYSSDDLLAALNSIIKYDSISSPVAELLESVRVILKTGFLLLKTIQLSVGSWFNLAE